MGLIARLRRSPHIHDDVADRFLRHQPAGTILDLPAGRGVNSRGLVAAGYTVLGGDLVPENFVCDGAKCDRLDMTKPLPYEDGSFDGILHSEGIEHIDNQLAVLQELARVLKPGGTLIVTTPNLLHLEGRLSVLLTGHAFRKRSIVVSSAGYWGPRDPDGRGTYFGHVFLINAFQLRFYLTHVGLEVIEVDTTRYSWKSLLLAPLLWPFLAFATWRILRRKRSNIPPDLQRTLRREILSGPVLFGRKLIMVARKPGAGST
jgi:SAM-dependent methyltransferase